MRQRIFLYAVLGLAAVAGAAACSDGEEGGSKPATGGTDGGGTGGVGGTGGIGGTGGTGGTPGCPAATFTAPASGAQLTAAQDLDGDCSNGMDLDVTVATDAADGTGAKLFANNQQVGSATAQGAVLQFAGVKLQSTGTTQLSVRFDSDPSCETVIDVSQQCGAACEISKPVLSASHPKLNGVPVAQGGDRASAAGQDYQAAFEVKTDIEDGQPVSLTVDGTGQAAVALANAGTAVFAGVTLIPDGDHKVQALCQPKAGQAGASAEVTYPVDTTPPDLTNTVPLDGHFFGPSDDSNASKPGLQFQVCGQTSAPDALDLPASLGGGEVNFCAGIGSSTPTCVAAKTAAVGGADGGCVELDCPGGAPFDLTVTLTDDAGNPTTKTIQGVTCASTLPSVQIVEPVSGTGSDITTHILAASAPQTRKDQNAGKAGAQYTVVACTDSASASSSLLVGLVGGSKSTVPGPAPTAAQPSDNCPAGLGFVIKFTDADLPESAEDVLGALVTATELTVEVTDVSTAKGTSPAVQVWVDSIAPTVSEFSPNPLCGRTYQSATAVQQALTFISTAVPVTGTVVTPLGTQNIASTAAQPGAVAMGTVTFDPGLNQVAASTQEPSGNTGALKSPCTVTVGNPPIVTWTAPTTATMLNAATDANSGTTGWQGTLTVQTDVGGSGGTVTFTYECGATIQTLGTVNIDAGGVATLPGVTLPECASAKITAETSNIPVKGVGTASLTKVVDTVVPDAPTGLVASIKDRRATTFGLAWTAPADGGQTVGGYAVRVSKSPITSVNFDVAEVVAFGGSPKAPGGAETLDVASRVIETDYYFAVAATDAAGNRGAVVSTGPVKATFNATVLAGAGTEGFGYSIDGAASINGDALADLIVGARSGNLVRVFFGKAGGYATTPDIVISGVGGTRFGFAARVVGDIDDDGFADIAISAPLEGGRGKVYVFKGRATWPATLNTTNADYVVEPDNVADPGFTASQFGYQVVPIGDFDADGAPDFAISAYIYGGGRGYVTIVRGVKAPTAFPATVTLPQAVGTRAIALFGDAAFPSNNWFGAGVASLGPYYAGGLPALVVGAAGQSVGRVYAFKGGAGVASTLQVSDGEMFQGTPAQRTGWNVRNLGPISGLPAAGVSSPGTSSNTGSYAQAFFGSASAGVFGGTNATYTNSAATGTGDQFGQALFGGGFSGSTVSVSLINSTQPDVVVSSIKLNGAIPAKLYILDGSKATTSSDVVASADVIYTLPSDWVGAAQNSGPLRDHDGDGYADIAIGEQAALIGYAGRVLVLW